jgi:hypothetical protein
MCNFDWDLFFKFIALGVSLITVLIALRKFHYEKNRDYFLKRLNEVYTPLFSLIIKQETFRDVFFRNKPRDERSTFNFFFKCKW